MRRTRAALTALGALTLSFGLVTATTVAADAAGPYVVKVGNQTSGTVPATATTIGANPQISFKDVTTGTALSCASGTANTVIKTGTNANGVGIATIPSSAFNNCVGPANIALTVTQTKTWLLNATGPVQSNGNVAGKITAIGAHVSAATASQCSFDVAGTVFGLFAQKPTTNQQLRLKNSTGSLTISNVQGCFGLVNSGDKASFNAVYKVTNSVGPISITNG